MAIMNVGYARVSAIEQNLDMQIDALKRAGCRKIFQEMRSGKAGTIRPEFEQMLRFIDKGDTLIVWKLDRLGRSLTEVVSTLEELHRQGIHFRSLTEEFDSTSAHGRFALQMQATLSEYFVNLTRERTIEGLRAAKARGVRLGRPPALSEADKAEARKLLEAGEMSVAKIADLFGVSRFTFYSYFPQARTQAAAEREAAMREP